jgi:phage-related protein
MAGGPSILVKIGADASGAVREITRFNKALSSKMSGFDKFKAGVDRAFLPAVGALTALSAAAIVSVKAAEESATANAKLGQVLGNMGMESATERVDAFADSLSAEIAVADEVINQTQAIIATFPSLAQTADQVGGAFDRATVVIHDMAAVLDTDAKSAALQVGKALEDPVKGLSALSRAGVSFTEQQKEQIKAMVAAGDAAAAQELILAELERQFGGVAKATANGSDKMAVSFGQITEAVGFALLPAFEAITPYVQRFAKFAADNAPLMTALGVAIAAVAAAVVVLKVALAAWTVVQWALNSALLANPITWIVLAIVALIGVVVLAYNKVDWFRNLVDAAWAGIQIAIEAVVNWFKDTAWPIIKVIIDAIVAYYKFLWTIVSTVFKWIWHNAIEPFVKWWQNTVWPITKRIIDFMVAYWKLLWEGVKLVWRGIQAAISVVVGWIQEYVAPGIEAAVKIIVAVFNVAKAVTTKVWNGIKTVMSPVVKWIAQVAFPPIKKAVDGLMTVFGLLRDHISNVFSTIRSIVGSAIDWILDKISGLTSAMNRAADVIGSVGFAIPDDDPNTIHPEQVTRGRSTSSGRGGSGRTINITVNGALDPVQTARQIRKILAASDARMGVAT